MVMGRKRSLENALVKRVQRHAELATLFRAARPAPGSDSPPQVQAWPARPDLPAAPDIQLLPSQSPGALPRANRLPAAAPLQPETHPSQPPAYPTPQKPAYPPPDGVEPGEGESKITPREWSRLQTIFRKHQETNDAGGEISTEAPSDTTASATSEAGSAVRTTGSQIPTAEAKSRPAGPGPVPLGMDPQPVRAAPTPRFTGTTELPRAVPPADVQRTPDPAATAAERGEPATAAPSPVPPSITATWPSAEAPPTSLERAFSQASRGPRRVVPPAHDSPSTVQAQREPPFSQVEPSQEAAITLVERAQDPSPISRPAGESIFPVDQGREPASTDRPLTTSGVHASEQHNPEPPIAELNAPERSASERQVPLQAAWPVQRTELPGSQTQELVDLPYSSSAGGEPGSVPRRFSFDDGELAKEDPAQPPAQVVEIIPPRRPRPAPAALQRQPLPHVGQDTISPYRPPSVGQDGILPDVQRASDEPVPTEIGPLPGDLWDLIGQPRPPQSQGLRALDQEPEHSSVQPPASRAPFEMRSAPGTRPPHEIAPPAAASPIPRSAESPQAVQRLPEDAASPATPGAEAPEGQAAPAEIPASQPTHEAGNGLDLEDLAGQVYTEIRRRLSYEWERLGRR